jgi:uncharacterized membrane protein YdcZ (DUF606 family)
MAKIKYPALILIGFILIFWALKIFPADDPGASNQYKNTFFYCVGLLGAYLVIRNLVVYIYKLLK